MSQSDLVRLHIVPLNQDLFGTIVPKSIQKLTSDTSFHSAQNDPDKGFGYVTLPKAEADKLRKKFNGSVLRGAKMSIEEARSSRKRARKEEETGIETSKKKSKRTKLQQGEIAGYELPAERKVKRGWTEKERSTSSKEKKSKREKSKYSNHEEVLFKLKSERKSGTKTSGGDVEKKASKAKGKDRSGATMIHEFENTTKYPSFLRAEKSTKTTGAVTFEDGKGWVDKDGNIVEAVKQRSRNVVVTPVTKEKTTTSRKSHAVNSASHAVDSPVNFAAADMSSPKQASSDSDTSSEESETSSDDASESDSDEDVDRTITSDVAGVALDAPRDVAADNADAQQSERIQDDEMVTESIHPLEALYKRRSDGVPKPAPIDTSFSFFGQDDAEEREEEQMEREMPQTPFTKQDLRTRVVRSAAPTPDTAAIGRRFSFSRAGYHEEEDEDGDQRATDSPLESKVGGPMEVRADDQSQGPAQESDFVKRFYEQRSEQNQGWKQRRRDALKQQRQRDSRRLSRRPAI